MTDKETMKLALKAFEVATTPLAKDRQEVLQAITALKEALAQPEQELLGCVEYIPCCTDQTCPKCKPTQPEQTEVQRLIALVRAQQITIDKLEAALAQPEQEPVALEAVYEAIIHWDEGGGKRSRRELARRIVDLYTTPPAAPAQPAPVQEIDWKDQYEKQKRRAEMWIAKYEKDIGPLEYAIPAAQPAPVQEPVAYMSHNKENFVSADDVGNSVPNWTDYYPTPLYATPPPCPTCEALARTVMMDQKAHDFYTTPQPQRTWIGMTDDDIGNAYVAWDDTDGASFADFARAIEAKLKEKNTP